jgi:hypothetical protein
MTRSRPGERRYFTPPVALPVHAASGARCVYRARMSANGVNSTRSGRSMPSPVCPQLQTNCCVTANIEKGQEPP